MFENCLYFNMNILFREINRMWDEEFTKIGLSPSHGYLLNIVLSRPGITQKDVANMMRLKPSTISRFIDTLVVKGYLLRQQEGKGSLLYPTGRAVSAQYDLEKLINNLNEGLVQQTTKEETEELLNKMIDYYKKLV
ncbi:winged helix-turn-helix transcriptional regulator [candidate division KSB1 bacterium]|nr:winged helix-turn-helix transcriptional regulator [candidate division KSB1 bacterium]